MQSEEPDNFGRLADGNEHDHAVIVPGSPSDGEREASQLALGWRSPIFGIILLIAIAGGVASGLIPIDGSDAIRPNQPPTAESEVAAVSAFPAPTEVGPTQRESAEGRAAAPAQMESELTQESSAGSFPLVQQSELEAAIGRMGIPEPQKSRLRHEVTEGTSRLVWIGFSDTVAEDGDRVLIESLGYSQEVRLFHRPTFIAVPVRPGTPILVRGSVDGDNQGITVAIHMQNAVLPLAPLQVGTTIQVPTP